jgi:formiminotetrahydrofolate cyclodeaminase
MLVDKTVRGLLDAFSAPDPTPGGGSASALAASVGASLLLMVAGLPKTRTNTDEERAALRAASETLTALRRQLVDAIDADTAAYEEVVAAYQRPKASEVEQQARKGAIQQALKSATDVPLAVMRLSAAALEQADVVSKHGLKSAASDVGVARALLKAGAEGARLNVEINLDGIHDAAYRDRVLGEMTALKGAVAGR